MDPVLQAIARAALGATGAESSWVLRLDREQLRAVAAAGPRAGDLLGAELPMGVGTAGYVVSSGQPMALVPRGPTPGWLRAWGRGSEGSLPVSCASRAMTTTLLWVPSSWWTRPGVCPFLLMTWSWSRC